jgi:hypothetical protein
MPTTEHTAITIRLAVPGDAQALAWLAEMDSAAVPPSPVLLAEADGRPRAAISLRDGSAIANPFHRTAAVLELLAARAEHLRTERSTRARRFRRSLARAAARAQ